MTRKDNMRALLACRSTRSARPTCTQILNCQESGLRQWLIEYIGVPVDVTVIRSRDPDADQPFYEQLVAEIGKGYDLLLVESLSRIGRGAATLNLLEEAKRRGVRVVAVADHFDSSRDPESDLTALLVAARHEYYLDHHARQIRRALRRRRKSAP